MGGINTGLNNALTGMGSSSKVILGIVLGGMMAIDMGGPFNKAAYVFGTAAIAAGNYDIMAAVMIGGMTLPVQLHWQHCCLRISSQKKRETQVLPTLSWVLHLSQKVRFRLQRLIHFMYFLPVS